MPGVRPPTVLDSADPLADPAVRRGSAAMLAEALRSSRLAEAFKSGRWAPARARRVVHLLVRSATASARLLAGAFVRKLLPLAEWAGRFRTGVLASHLAAGQATVGDRELDPPQAVTLGGLVVPQLGYLTRFVRQVVTGDQERDGTLVNRAGLYGAAVWAVSQGLEQAESTRAGFTEQLNILGFSDHCSDCLSESAAGWRPIGSGIPIGDRICRVRCACHYIFR